MQNTDNHQPGDLLTVPEAARELRLHATSISNLCRDGLIPGAFRAGRGRGRWRIPRAGLAQYNAGRTPQPADEIEPAAPQAA